jgi:hypothetical protein
MSLSNSRTLGSALSEIISRKLGDTKWCAMFCSTSKTANMAVAGGVSELVTGNMKSGNRIACLTYTV